MTFRKGGAPCHVEAPGPGEDRPSWVKVGVIAAVGFAIGIAWPRVAGVRLGPQAPGDAPVAAASARAPEAPAAAAPARETAAAPAAAVPATPAPVAAPAAPEVATISVQRALVVSCRTDAGETRKGGAGCGRAPALDGLVVPRLKRLAQCPAAAGVSGRLPVVFTVDFPANRLAIAVGKTSTIPQHEAFLACIQAQFTAVSLGTVDHEHPRYTVSYPVVLGSKGGTATNAPSNAATSLVAAPSAPTPPPAAAEAAPTGNDATAQITWDVAVVRDAPRVGQVVGRLPRGTRVQVGPMQEGWYRVRFGASADQEGWVYRSALGR